MSKFDPLMSSKSVEWETPDELFQNLDSLYKFTLDVCSTHENAKCKLHYTKEDDGLSQEWTGVCWMNPPYGREIKAWMKKAYNESLRGVRVVCLVPARTDTVWWHDYAIKGQITFIKGRLKFNGAKHSAPFPSAIVVFHK
tara:strand:+ start:82 stop:501 length:420 start_codon:yes stop_codon:yes gene_type:complete